MKTQRHVWSDSCWIPNGLNGPARDLLAIQFNEHLRADVSKANYKRKDVICISRFDRQARESQACDR